MKRLLMQILGAHRGGRALSEAFTRRPLRAPLEVHLADPVPGRANALVPLWQSHGIPAEAHEASAADLLPRSCNLRILDMDDIDAHAHALSSEPEEDVIQFAFLASAPVTPADGGVVLGFGGTITRENTALRRQASELAGAFANFAGHERTSSRMIRGQILSGIQVDSTRRELHRQLAEDAHAYLEGTPREGLYCVETLSAASSPVYRLLSLEPAEAGGNYPALRRRALEIAEQGITSPGAAVILLNQNRRWAYLVLLRRRGIGYPLQVSRALEFKAPAPHESRLYVTD